jgi:hypothetical protein
MTPTPTINETTNPLAGGKRPQALALAADDPAAAEQHAKRRRTTKKVNVPAFHTGALVPFMPPRPCIDAVPLAAVAPGRSEPPWMRTGLFWDLGFRTDMEAQFIAEKAVTATDLDTQQSRFRLPNDGVLHHLRGMLSDAELEAANLLHERTPRARTSKVPPLMIQGTEQGGGNNRMRKKGKRHVGLPVVLVDAGGRRKELKLTQWDSSGSTVIHGDGYLDFVRQCDFMQDDVVEIWAFREKFFRLFGVDMCEESPLHVLIFKEQQQAAYRGNCLM